MYTSPHVLRRLAHDRHTENLARAANDRLIASRAVDAAATDGTSTAVRNARDVRAWLADALLDAAARLSPAHRDALCEVRPSIDTSQAT